MHEGKLIVGETVIGTVKDWTLTGSAYIGNVRLTPMERLSRSGRFLRRAGWCTLEAVKCLIRPPKFSIKIPGMYIDD